MDRRSFLGAAWMALAAAGAILTGAGRAGAAKKIAIDLAKLPGLEEVGNSAYASIKKKKILFIRTSEKGIVAISPVCTHQKCAVEYRKKWGEIRCTCHGSKFTRYGKVKSGPASKDLVTYPAWLEKGKVMVKL